MIEKYFTRLPVGIWFVFCVISIIYVSTHNYPVFDDSFNLTDIKRYAQHGLNIKSIQQHANPAGLASYVWAGVIGKIFGDNLVSYRLSMWMAWVLIFLIFTLLQPNLENSPVPLFTFSILFLISDFYSLLAASTLLTEGPSLLFALTGFWILTISIQKDFTRQKPFIFTLNVIASLLVGLAVISRIYYITLIPAMYLTLAICFLHDKTGVQKMLFYGISTVFCIVPVVLLYLLWGGFTPPMLKQVYPMFSSHIGFNLNRILPPILYIGLYSFPILVAGWQREFISWHHLIFPVLLIAIINIQDVYVWRMGVPFVGTGFFDNVISILNQKNRLLGMIGSNLCIATGGLSFSIICEQCYRKLKKLPEVSLKSDDIALVFGIMMLFFFCLEQILIQGNISFYERYMLQIYPFLGIVLFSFIKLTPKVIIWLCISFCISIFMLYRN
jgi:hypothetical protein